MIDNKLPLNQLASEIGRLENSINEKDLILRKYLFRFMKNNEINIDENTSKEDLSDFNNLLAEFKEEIRLKENLKQVYNERMGWV